MLINRFPLQAKTNFNRYGYRIHLEQDSSLYYADAHQKFVPYEIDQTGHPFKGCEGQLVGITDWLSNLRFDGATSGFITRVRTMRMTASGQISHQVEILGRPTCWSHADHFERIN